VSKTSTNRRRSVKNTVGRDIDALFAKWDCNGSPGAIIAVIRAGKVIHQKGYGLANIEDNVPFTTDTVLRLGSTTKHMCATCILVLENRKLLSLEDDIRKYVPEMPVFADVITLRHLLTMTSGLWDGLNLLLFAGLDTAAPLSRQQQLRLYCRQRELMFRPGEDCTYSNTNYSLLSLVIERISGLSLGEFMQAELFEPLGMKHTRLVPEMKEKIEHKARGYLPRLEGGFEAGYMMVELDGNGGVDSTISDMLRWFDNYRDDRCFGPDYRQRLEAPSHLNDGRLLEYRLGMTVSDYRGTRVVRHSGGMPGYLCDFVFYPEPDLGIILFANVMAPELLELPERIADLLLEDELLLPRESTFVDTADKHASELLGVYASGSHGLVLQLADENGKLVCYLLGELNPLYERNGWLESRKNPLAVRPADPGLGRAGGLQLRQGCQELIDLEPVDDPLRYLQAMPADFETFTGHYWLETLDEIHRVSLQDGRLIVSIGSPVRDLVWSELAPVTGDLFVAPVDGEPSCTNVTVQFLRTGNGQVNGLTTSINRCRHVFLKKLPDDRMCHEPG